MLERRHIRRREKVVSSCLEQNCRKKFGKDPPKRLDFTVTMETLVDPSNMTPAQRADRFTHGRGRGGGEGWGVLKFKPRVNCV